MRKQGSNKSDMNLMHTVFSFFLGCFFSLSEGQQLFPPNRRFVPGESSNEEQLQCTIPNYQAENATYFPPPSGYCLTSNALNDGEPLSYSELDALAQAYAPVLFFHPLENYTMETVDAIFANASAGNIVFSLDGFSEVFDDKLNLTSLLRSSRDPTLAMNSDSYYFQHFDLLQDTVFTAGAGFDETGLSRAPIYYRAFEWENDTVVINYYFYFPINGFANMGVLSLVNEALHSTSFVAQPFDGHETDWETMRVMVCKSNATSINSTSNSSNLPPPLAVSYQHEKWNQIDDCVAGECTLYQETSHPVGFVSLGTHEIHSVSSRNIIFDNLRSSFVIDLQGVVSVDRTVYLDEVGSYRMFLPNSTNVIRHKEQTEIVLSETAESQYWQGFAGRWGGTNRDISSSYSYTCISGNQTSVVDCPDENEDPVFYLVLELLEIFKQPSNMVIQAAQVLRHSTNNNYPTTGLSPRGPTTGQSIRTWVAASNAPIWSQFAPGTSSTDVCNNLTAAPNAERIAPAVTLIPINATVTGVITFCVLVMFVNIVSFSAFALLHTFQKAPLRYDNNGKITEPGWYFRYNCQRQTYYYTFYYIFTMCGVALFFNGHNALKFTLVSYIGVDLRFAMRAIQIFGILLILIDTIMLVVLWIPTNDLWIRAKMVYYDMVGNEEKAQACKRKLWWDNPMSLKVFKFMHGLLLASVIFSTLMVVFACFNIGIAYGFGEVCNKTVIALSNVCFSMSTFGIQVHCGQEFDDFCGNFAQQEIITTVWGSFLTAAGHFYLVSSSGAAVRQFQSILGTIYQLPNREKYLFGISNLSLIIDKDELDLLAEQERPNAEPCGEAPDEIPDLSPVKMISFREGIC